MFELLTGIASVPEAEVGVPGNGTITLIVFELFEAPPSFLACTRYQYVVAATTAASR
jgi:hypothetical protein